MKYALNTLRWIRANEPVRLYLYSSAGVGVAALVGKGLIDGTASLVILGGVALILGVPLTEGVRSQVTPAARAVAIAPKIVEVAQGVALDHLSKIDVNAVLKRAREASNWFARGEHHKP